MTQGGLATKATSPAAKKGGMYSRGLTLDNRALINCEPGPNKEKLWPVSGKFVAVDATGTKHVFYWDMMEIELNGPVVGGHVKITGTATEARW